MRHAGSAAAVLLAAGALAACGSPESAGWLGYAEGEEAFIAPPAAGWLTSIAAARGAQVAEGDILFTLDATRETAARDNARAAIAVAEAQGAQADAQAAQAAAQRAEAEAQVQRTESEFARQEGLVRIGASPRRDLEQAAAALEGARAARDGAEAQRHQAEALKRQAEARADEARAALTTAEFNLSERTVRARVTGYVQDVYFRQGEYANAGAPVVSILPPGNVFVRFFVPEEEVASLALGDPVLIACDGCPPGLGANVSFIAAESEYTPPIIYSVGNRQRLVFKAEASAPGGLALRPGLPVEVSRAP